MPIFRVFFGTHGSPALTFLYVCLLTFPKKNCEWCILERTTPERMSLPDMCLKTAFVTFVSKSSSGSAGTVFESAYYFHDVYTYRYAGCGPQEVDALG
jgi:hypothetical protein